MKVSNKTILVTGGGNGMGRELVLQLLRKGARVAAVDMNEDALRETYELAINQKDRLSLHVVDITDRAEVEKLPDEVLNIHGAIDAVINNAGIIQPFVKINELDYNAINKVMDVNFYGTVYMIKTFLPYLYQRPVAHIANVSSMGGFLPVPGQSIYGASKAAVKLMTEALYSELKDTQIGVTIIFPGAVGTNIAENSGIKMDSLNSDNAKKFKTMDASKAAEKMIDGIEKNKFRVLVGSDASFMDKLYRFSPRFATNFIYNQMKSLLKY